MKRRDAKTGRYIDIEDSATKDASTWTEEKDYDKGKFVEKLFDTIASKSYVDDKLHSVVKLSDIVKLFSRYNKTLNTNMVFISQLNYAIEGLTYMSESDYPFHVFVGQSAQNISKEVLLKQIDADNDVEIEEVDYEEFFDKLTGTSESDTESDADIADAFGGLKQLLDKNLSDLKVFKVGKIEIDIYIVGLTEDDKIRGVKTTSIET